MGVEVDSSQRTMLRTFLDLLKQKQEDKIEKGCMQIKQREMHKTPIALNDVNRLILTDKGYVTAGEANNAYSVVENDQLRKAKEPVMKNRPPTKRKIEETESNELKR